MLLQCLGEGSRTWYLKLSLSLQEFSVRIDELLSLFAKNRQVSKHFLLFGSSVAREMNGLV